MKKHFEEKALVILFGGFFLVIGGFIAFMGIRLSQIMG